MALKHFADQIFIRNISAVHLFETFLVTAISTILLTRFYLAIMHYPQVTTRTLHIAHMLWGGLFMLIAFILVMSFLSNASKYTATLVGGVGFGLFIDELGKFVTRDNNYFFRPTVALIYVTFIIIFLIFQSIEKYRKYTKQEYIVNAIELLKDAVTDELDTEEKKQLLAYIRKAGYDNELASALKTYIKEIEAKPKEKPNIFVRMRNNLASLYQSLTENRWFANIIILFFVFQAITSLVHVAILFLFTISSIEDRIAVPFSPLTITQQGQLIATTLSALFIVVGIMRMYHSRLQAYIQFRRALLITIFITQFFAFYQTQFFALIGLAANIILLVGIEYMISQEQLERGES